MTGSTPSSGLPSAALNEFTKVADADWQGGIPLAELLDRINRVAVLLVGDNDPAKPAEGRVRSTFTDRSFRHYQTLGCIDAPEKLGRMAAYGFRHFVQALLVRRLLWERVSAERITALMAGRSTEETKGMLLDGIQVVARERAGEESSASVSESGETWKRIRVARGVELHLSGDLPGLKPGEVEGLLEKLETALRRNV